jgi:ABC-type multidrug transport system fused ATPase/permease subunit
MARAMLRNTKIFFLDEATASVDEQADANIQKAIRTSFNEGTVITIAHRLKTIIDYDRVMVLDQGELMEFDTPYNLMLKEGGSIFKSM